MNGWKEALGDAGDRARLALDMITGEPGDRIPSWLLNVMEWSVLEELAGHEPGSYAADPEEVYGDFQRRIGACMIDQWIPRNPLSMGSHGYEGKERGATTGAEQIVRHGRLIDSPEAVVADLEEHVWPELEASRTAAEAADADMQVAELVEREAEVQRQLGPDILKVPYGVASFPHFDYGAYGYANYFMAYALYPEVMERTFQLQAAVAEVRNRRVARAIVEGGLPPLIRLDHDMADSRGTLVRVESLDRLWFPHFSRAIEPLLEAGIRLIWHCDGNLMEMVPRLIEAGIRGFQGFQYEDGMAYEAICRMRDRDGEPLLIIAGVSVTTTLPHGPPAEVRDELRWLVAHGPPRLFLGGSSSIAPGTPKANIAALVEGLTYYREQGRGAGG